MATRRLPPHHLRTGFTLVEVLVALLIMAVIATIGWRGIDSMARTRELAQESAEKTLRLSAIVSQLEADLMAVQDNATVPALAFDGASLRLVRRSEGGLQMVVWALREGRWQRWASAASTRVQGLQDAWMASQQLQGLEPAQMTLLQDVSSWQVYFYRGGWSNAQSSGNVLPEVPAAPVVPAAAAAAAPGSQAQGSQLPGNPPATPAATAPPRQQLPTGVRIVRELPQGRLTRDIALGPH
jgi:general secretion pathway protein J